MTAATQNTDLARRVKHIAIETLAIFAIRRNDLSGNFHYIQQSSGTTRQIFFFFFLSTKDIIEFQSNLPPNVRRCALRQFSFQVYPKFASKKLLIMTSPRSTQRRYTLGIASPTRTTSLRNRRDNRDDESVIEKNKARKDLQRDQ